MSKTCVGSWHIRPTPARVEGKPHIKKTWTGPISPELYGKGLKDLCNKTQDNLNRLSFQMKTADPCLEYGLKHWHPDARPQSVCNEPIERPKTPGRWESVEVMFTDNKFLDSLGSQIGEETDQYVDPPARKSFCYLCSTLEEHERHMQQHRPRRPATARPRITYIAPPPKQKVKTEEDDEILVKERLYKVEVYTSQNKVDAGTSANVFISIKGSMEVLPRTQLVKKRGSAQMVFMRASKETFHIKGPFLGNLQILSVEHDGREKSHAWHLDHIEVTDVKAMKTWVFYCEEWLSTFKKPHYSNRLDLQATEKDTPATVYSIEVHTGKQKMAGTDSNIFITLIGQHGSSKKIHLVDPSSDKKLFEKNSVDKFRIQIRGVGELKRIRIEHDGKGFAAGWFLSKVVILDSERPKDCYYFTYGGWIARDEGDGRLWREINAKKRLPKEIKDGVDTRYDITCKTGDKRFAGTDANVFIQLAGTNGITPKLKLDDAKNNFERNMVDNFDIRSVNVGPMDHIVIGHDNFGPGAGWYLEKVTVRRYIPKTEARERLKKMRKKQKLQKKKKLDDSDDETDVSEDEDGRRTRSRKDGERRKDKRDKKKQSDQNLYTVSSESEEESETGSEYTGKKEKGSKRPGSAYRRDLEDRRPGSPSRRDSDNRRPGSATRRNEGSRRPSSAHGSRRPSSSQGRYDRDDKKSRERSRRNRSSGSESEESDESRERRPGSALRRDYDKSDRDSNKHRRSSTSADRNRRGSSVTNGRRVSTSASSFRSKNKKDDEDDNLDDIKVSLYEECVFECNNWLASDEGDGLFVRELKVSTKNTFYKEPKM